MNCPVCRAGWRGQQCCSRCGADLAPLMRLALHSHALRHRARQALCDGDPERARTLAAAAQAVHATAAGRGLRLLAAWLAG